MNEKNKLCEKTTERRMTILHGNAQNYPENGYTMPVFIRAIK